MEYSRLHHYQNVRDYDTRSQSSHKSDTSGGRGEPPSYNFSANSSVGSHDGSAGGSDSRGFPLHSHVHFRHAAAMSATHLLNGDPAHQFPPSLYQSSTDAPKSDTATVCSSSMLEDIEDVGSHYDGDSTQGSTSKHSYPPPSAAVRRTSSKEGNRLVDFAERSQAVFPKQSKPTGTSQHESSSLGNTDEDSSTGTTTQHKQGMGPPLSRHRLLQLHGISPFRTGSVKSGGSTAGSDVIVNVGSDCGGSLADIQSVQSQEDAALLASGEAAATAASTASTSKADTLETSNNSTEPHPLLCDQSSRIKSGRISPGGTIYRGRGVRRYKGRFYALPLKRFHQDGVHLHSDSEAEGSATSRSHLHHEPQWDERYRSKDDYQRGDKHDYNAGEDSSSSRHRRDRSRSRSRSPPAEREVRYSRAIDQTRGYKIDRK